MVIGFGAAAPRFRCNQWIWEAEVFHLQGAETVNGPWYDLDVESPVMIPAGATARAFRLRCD
jgi:hypothetical protein